MVDREAIFTELTQRNAVRRAAHLPLLDMRTEYAHEIALAQEREFRVAYDALVIRYAADKARIEALATAEIWPDEAAAARFRATRSGQWAIQHRTRRRFIAFLREQHLLSQEPVSASRNATVYGAGNGE